MVKTNNFEISLSYQVFMFHMNDFLKDFFFINK